jgi:hypothetical protein
MGRRWPKIMCPTELWKATGEKSVILLMRMRNWQWIGDNVRHGDESIEKQTLGWNPQGARRKERPKQNLKRTLLEEAGNESKHGVRLRGWWATDSDGDPSQMPYVPNGMNYYY